MIGIIIYEPIYYFYYCLSKLSIMRGGKIFSYAWQYVPVLETDILTHRPNYGLASRHKNVIHFT